MGPVQTEFLASEMYPALAHRGDTMARVIAHLEGFDFGVLIETGTARARGNWAGDGQSTLVWDWVAERLNIDVISIDLNQEYLDTAKSQTFHVEYRRGDSVSVLSDIAPSTLNRCAVLYLDSFDWTPELNFDSSFHHMAELATVWAHLPAGCLIVVDDCHDRYNGKHIVVVEFMKKLGIAPAFTGYQTGWIKLDRSTLGG